MTETKNPRTPAQASKGSDFANRAGSDLDLTTLPVAINQLRTRFGWSASRALLVAGLAGIGPQEARS